MNGIRKAAVAILLCGGALAALTGCSGLSPVVTNESYAPSDGVELSSGPVTWSNALWVSSDGEKARLVGRVTNSGTDDLQVNIQVTTAAGKQNIQFQLVGGGTRDLDDTVVDDLGVNPGASTPVYLQAGSFEGDQQSAPVLGAELSEYASLVPSASTE